MSTQAITAALIRSDGRSSILGSGGLRVDLFININTPEDLSSARRSIEALEA